MLDILKALSIDGEDCTWCRPSLSALENIANDGHVNKLVEVGGVELPSVVGGICF